MSTAFDNLPFAGAAGKETEANQDPILNYLGIKSDEVEKAKVGDVERAAVWSVKKCAKVLDKLCEAWGLPTEKKGSVLLTVLWYYVLNGASPRAPAAGMLELDGKSLDTHVLHELMEARPRRFCRCFAEMTLKLCKREDRVEAMRKLAQVRNFPTAFSYLCFDWVDFCVLDDVERRTVEIHKVTTLVDAALYNDSVGDVGMHSFAKKSGQPTNKQKTEMDTAALY